MKHLPPKQQLFVIEYTKDWNGTQAAIRAGYSKKTANEQAARLLANVSVSKTIQEVIQARREETELTVKDLQRYLRAVIEAEVTNVVTYNESGVSFAQNSDDIPHNERIALQSIEVIEEHHKESSSTLHTKVKFHDKLKAIELYGKTIGAFKEIVEVGSRYEDQLRILWEKIEAAQKGHLTLKIAGTNQVICIGSNKGNSQIDFKRQKMSKLGG